MKEQFIDQPFVYTGYTKIELARMYNPHMTLRSAVVTFNRWIRHDPKLWKKLTKSGVDVYTQYYRKSQVRMIVDHLGEP